MVLHVHSYTISSNTFATCPALTLIIAMVEHSWMYDSPFAPSITRVLLHNIHFIALSSISIFHVSSSYLCHTEYAVILGPES